MTARPCYDWSPVGYGSHPVPGDSSEVLRGAREFRETEGHLRRAAQGLSALESGNETESKAIDALDSDMRELISVLWAALDRYDRAADALTTYAPIMLRAQEQAEQALQAAASARQDYEQAASTANELRRQTMYTFDPDQRRELLEGYNRAKGQASYAQADYLDAKGKIDDAAEMARAAANRAADAIQSAISNKDLNDSLLDKLKDFGVKALDALTEALKVIMKTVGDAVMAFLNAELFWEILDWASLAFTIVGAVLVATGVGAPIGFALLAIGGVLGYIGAARSLIMAGISFREGRPVDGALYALSGALGLVRFGIGGKLIRKFVPRRVGPHASELHKGPQVGREPHTTDLNAARKTDGKINAGRDADARAVGERAIDGVVNQGNGEIVDEVQGVAGEGARDRSARVVCQGGGGW